MKIHKIKSWPKFFQPISSGTRTHELRRNDKNYKIGDILELQEYDPELEQYTGRSLNVVITSITSSNEPCAVSEEALNREFCILSIKLM